jgi:CheY-like chemotaxis protein/HPt (histidine-containing phosphotransfer) domain-containing protein
LKKKKNRPRPCVLIVEDNPVNQKVALRQVASLGYQADVVANGFEALAALLRGQYSVVLMDCQMPKMDGLEATAAIRRREGGRRHTPIIAMTANVVKGDREKCLEAGMDDYISKPVKRDILKRTLEKWATQADGPVSGSETDSLKDGRDQAVNDSTGLIGRLQELEDEFGPGMVVTLATLFISDTEGRLAAIRRCVGERDCKQLEREAHGLKGSSANLGIGGMARICAELEVNATKGLWNEFEEMVEVLNRIWLSLQPLVVSHSRTVGQ